MKNRFLPIISAFGRIIENTTMQIAGPFKTDKEFVTKPLVTVTLLISAFVILRNAWVSDDAHIILRTLENFSNGYGLRWNIDERVQVFTCPLWTLILALFYRIFGEGYFSTIAVSTIIAVLGIYLLVFRIADRLAGAVLVLVILLFSRAYIDFSTSGLENALNHLLIASYYLLFCRSFENRTDKKSFSRASLILGLIALNRMDTILLLLPAHFLIWFKGENLRGVLRKAGIIAVNFIPFILWLLFSLFYYGFLFPNTAYAKLATGISSYVLLMQGLCYLRNCLDWDPLTALTIGTALVGGLLYRPRKHPVRAALSLGILLSLIYVAKVGGDHMSGRFLTPALTAAVLSLSTWRIGNAVHEKVFIVLFVVVGLTGRSYPFAINSDEKRRELDTAGIVDDRNFAAVSFGIFSMSPAKPMVANYLGARGTTHLRAGAHVMVSGHIGLFGYNVGPEVHLVDMLGLTDPLTARLSFGVGEWRPAHFARRIPPGYVEEIDGTGEIVDSDLREYYRHLKIIISGNLWSLSRLDEIVRFNTGAYDYLKDRYEMRDTAVFDYSNVSGFRRNTAWIPWNEKDSKIIGRFGIGIRISDDLSNLSNSPGTTYTVSLGAGEIYDIYFMSRGRVVEQYPIDLREMESGYLREFSSPFKTTIKNKRIDLVRIKPRGTFGKFSIGHFRIENPPTVIKLSDVKQGGPGITFLDRDVDIVSTELLHNGRIHLSLMQDSVFRVELFEDTQRIWKSVVARDDFTREMEQWIAIPRSVSREGFNKIKVVPVSGTQNSKIGFLEVI